MAADALAKRGHEVVWWTSNFSHHFKRFRCYGWKDIEAKKNFVIRLVPTTAYRNNIGLGRILRDVVFAFRVYHRGKNLLPPECILYSESPLTFGYAGQKLGEHHKVPVVFHQMDLWPEFFETVFPNPLRSLLHFLLQPIYANRKKNYRELYAVTALARPYLEAPLAEAPKLKHKPNAVIYNGIDVQAFRESMKSTDVSIERLPQKPTNETWAVFAGSLGPSYDIPTLIAASRYLKHQKYPIRILIAGDGPFRPQVETAAAEADSRLTYLGKLEPAALARLYGLCDIGLCAYSSRSNVEMPDKIYDYTAAGLPVINSLCGEVSEILKEHGNGLQYVGGDVRSFMEALTKLACNEDLCKTMAERSRQIGMLFDKNVQYENLAIILENLVKAKSS
jgi:glycosyltransferase involved in cell wall biosynthesis